MGSGLDYKTFVDLAHSLRASYEREPLDRIKDHAERNHLKPHDTLLVTFEKNKVTEERDVRSTIHWTMERKTTVEKALTPEFQKVIDHMEKLGHSLTSVRHPDRYSRDMDKWAKEPSRDPEPAREMKR